MTTTAVRCSAWIKEQGVDPIGTAGSYAGYLLLEWPLPWPRDLSEIARAGCGARRAGRHRAAAAGPGAAVRRRGGPAGRPLHAEAGPGLLGYERAERLVPVDRVEAAAIALARGDDGDPELGQGRASPTTCSCARTASATCAAARTAPPW